MKIEEILKLVDAGYTAEEIKALESSEPETNEDDKTTSTNGTFTMGQLEALEAMKPLDIRTFTEPLENKINELVETVAKLQTDNIDGAQGGNAEPAPSIEEMVSNFTKDM